MKRNNYNGPTLLLFGFVVLVVLYNAQINRMRTESDAKYWSTVNELNRLNGRGQDTAQEKPTEQPWSFQAPQLNIGPETIVNAFWRPSTTPKLFKCTEGGFTIEMPEPRVEKDLDTGRAYYFNHPDGTYMVVVDNHSSNAWELTAKQKETIGRHQLDFLASHGYYVEIAEKDDQKEFSLGGYPAYESKGKTMLDAAPDSERTGRSILNIPYSGNKVTLGSKDESRFFMRLYRGINCVYAVVVQGKADFVNSEDAHKFEDSFTIDGATSIPVVTDEDLRARRAAIMKRMAGKFRGTLEEGIESTTRDPVETTFELGADGKLTGSYTIDSKSGRETGFLTQKDISGDKVDFAWSDRFGRGTLEIHFIDDYKAFDGFYYPDGEREANLKWGGGVTRRPWNGKR